MSERIGIVVLAAGEGRRLKIDVPKPLAPLNSKKLIDYPLQAAMSFLKDSKLTGQISFVVGHQREKVELYLKDKYDHDFKYPVQEKQLGTADALKSYFSGVKNANSFEYTLVLCADTPFLNSDILKKLWSRLSSDNANAVAATFKEDNPYGYGRIIRGKTGFKIVEQKEANEEELAICEVNSGVYLFKTDFIIKALSQVGSANKATEFYLTDVFTYDNNVIAELFEDKALFSGINSPAQLVAASKQLYLQKAHQLLQEGVIILDPQTTYIEESVQVGAGSTIYPGCYIFGESIIGSDVVIEPGCILRDAKLGAGVLVKAYSYLESAVAGVSCTIGPYARLRPGTVLGERVKIGNFVETKNSSLEAGVAVSHLSYVGDALIGSNTNIGCGFITCNYDGENKHQTKIGSGSFIGSDTQTIAPVEIGERAYIASGSTINQDVPDGAFSLSRSRQVNKLGAASRFLKGKWKVNL